MQADDGQRKLVQIALMWAGKLGPAGFRRLVAYFGGVLEVLSASEQELSAPGLRLEADQVRAILDLEDQLTKVEAQWQVLADEHIAVLCDFETEYPAILHDLRNRPPVVCMAGRIVPLDDPAVNIVGTRSPTQDGLEMARALGRAFAEHDCTVVSGLARGCDTATHTGALEGGGRTIAVLGSGIRTIRPTENIELARQIAERGSIISEQPPEVEPSVARLMARNRLQSVLARGTIVVQSGAEGGSINTAASALKQGRLLYAVEWRQRIEKTVGNNKLLDGEAAPVRGVQDVPHICEALFVHKQKLMRQRAAAEGQMKLFG